MNYLLQDLTPDRPTPVKPRLSPSLKQKLSIPLNIGDLTLNSRVFQSPLSGVTDLVFRRLVRRYAPDSMLYTEMVSATEIHHLSQLPQVME
ncbi:MAG: tRNA-dihydrouridine synthase, partial [Snowella sp.]